VEYNVKKGNSFTKCKCEITVADVASCLCCRFSFESCAASHEQERGERYVFFFTKTKTKNRTQRRRETKK
jgi:hypothetical protein